LRAIEDLPPNLTEAISRIKLDENGWPLEIILADRGPGAPNDCFHCVATEIIAGLRAEI
jgi:hypothetical protein